MLYIFITTVRNQMSSTLLEDSIKRKRIFVTFDVLLNFYYESFTVLLHFHCATLGYTKKVNSFIATGKRKRLWGLEERGGRGGLYNYPSFPFHLFSLQTDSLVSAVCYQQRETYQSEIKALTYTSRNHI